MHQNIRFFLFVHVQQDLELHFLIDTQNVNPALLCGCLQWLHPRKCEMDTGMSVCVCSGKYYWCWVFAGNQNSAGIYWHLLSFTVLEMNMPLLHEWLLVFKIPFVNLLSSGLIRTLFLNLLHSTILCFVAGQLWLWSTTCWRPWWRWTPHCSTSSPLPTKQTGSGEEPWSPTTVHLQTSLFYCGYWVKRDT